jgi:DNA-binding response OmpR family regulator
MNAFGEADMVDDTAILVVDDDPGVRDLFARTLKRVGFKVTVAEDGHAAIREMERERFDAAVIDIIMPEKEGIETIVEARARWPECRLIAMSGGGRIAPDDFLDLARIFGAHATLRKPMRSSQLIAALEAVLGRPKNEADRPRLEDVA